MKKTTLYKDKIRQTKDGCVYTQVKIGNLYSGNIDEIKNALLDIRKSGHNSICVRRNKTFYKQINEMFVPEKNTDNLSYPYVRFDLNTENEIEFVEYMQDNDKFNEFQIYLPTNNLLQIMDEQCMDIKTAARSINMNQWKLETILANQEQYPESILNELAQYLQTFRPSSLLKRFSEPIIITTWIHKGGTGKTSVLSNLAYTLANLGYNVLMIDGDSQCDLSGVMFPRYLEPDFEKHNFYEALMMQDDFRNYIIPTEYDNLNILPGAGTEEKELENMLKSLPERIALNIVNKCMAGIINENYYDFVLIDTDKSISLLNKAILAASDYIIPVADSSFMSAKGLVTVGEMIEQVKPKNPNLTCLGVIFNNTNSREVKAEEQAFGYAQQLFPYPQFGTIISATGAMKLSQYAHSPLRVYDPSNKVCKQILQLTMEILERIGE